MPPLSATEGLSYCAPLPSFNDVSPATTSVRKGASNTTNNSGSTSTSSSNDHDDDNSSISQNKQQLPLLPSSPHTQQGTTTTTNSATAAKKRSPVLVSFAPSVIVRNVQHLNDISKEEIEATWYTPDEFKELKRDVHITVKMMSRNERLGIDQCIRGLEHKTKDGRARRMMNQIESMSAVLDEQDYQLVNNIYYDDERIARVYKSYTIHCAASAHFHGLSDQRVATGDMDYFHDMQPGGVPPSPTTPTARGEGGGGEGQQQFRQKRRLSCTAA